MAERAQKKASEWDPRGNHYLERLLADSTCSDQGLAAEIFSVAHDVDSSVETRALMFLLYGSRLAAKYTDEKQPVFHEKDGWFRRAYYFGLKYGLPPQPMMVARILEYVDGLDLAVAYVRECDAAPVFKIKESIGIELLDSGVDAPGLISLCRALHAIEPLSERLLDASEEIELILPHLRQEEEPNAIKLRRDQVDRLSFLIGKYMLRTRSTKVIILLAGFINTMLATAPLTSQLVETIEYALGEFLKFDDEMLSECLKIEIDQDRGKVISSLKEVTDILAGAARTS
jgi:hypothetical protein